MDENLSWASSPGDAYVNHQDQVMSAVQALRRQARQAGHLDNSAQQKVVTKGNTIVIEPAGRGRLRAAVQPMGRVRSANRAVAQPGTGIRGCTGRNPASASDWASASGSSRLRLGMASLGR